MNGWIERWMDGNEKTKQTHSRRPVAMSPPSDQTFFLNNDKHFTQVSENF